HERVTVLLPLPLLGPLDYKTGGLDLAPGDFVQVPLSGRQVVGVVWEGAEAKGAQGKVVAAERLRPVTARFDLPPLPDLSRKFLAWVAAYNMVPVGPVLKMAMSIPAVFEPEPLRRLY